MLKEAQARLRIVPTETVLPHEIADPARERRIEARLREDRILRDPLMIGAIPDLDRYILLDGTNRQRALAALGYPLLLAQILDYSDPNAVNLRTWCHAAAAPLSEILEEAASITGISVAELAPLGAPDALRESATLAVLLDGHRRYALSRDSASPGRAALLRQLVEIYEDRMVREDCDPDGVEERGMALNRSDGPVTLVGYPPFTRSQVVAMALQQTPIPAGITRHVITEGRALRVNLPLSVLKTADVDDANAALGDQLSDLQPRLYREPTILFDS